MNGVKKATEHQINLDAFSDLLVVIMMIYLRA